MSTSQIDGDQNANRVTPSTRWRSAVHWCIGMAFLLLVAIRLRYPVFSAPHIDLAVYLKGANSALSAADAIYDLGPGLPFTYPPFAALLLTAFAVLSERLATFALTALSIAALVSLTSRWLHWRQPEIVKIPTFVVVLLTMIAMLLQPFARTFELGQINILLLWAIVFDVTMKQESNRRGILVGCAAGFKLTPGIFIVWFALTRQWRAFFTSAASFVGTVALGFLFLPRSAWKYWTETFFDAERVGGLAYSGNQSLNGMLWRALGEGGNRVLWLVLSAIVAAVCIWLMRKSFRAGDMRISLLCAAFFGLLVSPVSWDHHWVWFWPAMLLLVSLVLSQSAERTPLSCSLKSEFSAVAESPKNGGANIRVATIILLAVLTTVQLANVIWIMPNENGREYHVSVLGKILTDAYPILAIGIIGIFAALYARVPRR